MTVKLKNLVERVRTSLWFLPTVMTCSAIALAFILLEIDRDFSYKLLKGTGLLYRGNPQGARSILSTIAGSMITITGVVFSITLVALTLASNQFGPRLLRNFIGDRGTQVVLGTFIATFMYSLIVLHVVRGTDENDFVPKISIAVALLLSLISLGVLIYFIDHVSTTIQANHVIKGAYNDFNRAIERYMPDKADINDEAALEQLKAYYDNLVATNSAQHLFSTKQGYLQAIDMPGLKRFAAQHQVTIELLVQPGDFLHPGDVIIKCYNNRVDEKEAAKDINKAFITGVQRTPEQEIEFPINQIVEIAIRALSPSMNDPFTAITCIDWLGAGLCKIARRKLPLPYICDDEHQLLLVIKPVSFAKMLDIAFAQIRRNSSGHIPVKLKLLQTLERVAIHSPTKEMKMLSYKEAEKTFNNCSRTIQDEDDLELLQKQYKQLLEAIDVT